MRPRRESRDFAGLAVSGEIRRQQRQRRELTDGTRQRRGSPGRYDFIAAPKKKKKRGSINLLLALRIKLQIGRPELVNLGSESESGQKIFLVPNVREAKQVRSTRVSPWRHPSQGR